MSQPHTINRPNRRTNLRKATLNSNTRRLLTTKVLLRHQQMRQPMRGTQTINVRVIQLSSRRITRHVEHDTYFTLRNRQSRSSLLTVSHPFHLHTIRRHFSMTVALANRTLLKFSQLFRHRRQRVRQRLRSRRPHAFLHLQNVTRRLTAGRFKMIFTSVSTDGRVRRVNLHNPILGRLPTNVPGHRPTIKTPNGVTSHRLYRNRFRQLRVATTRVASQRVGHRLRLINIVAQHRQLVLRRLLLRHFFNRHIRIISTNLGTTPTNLLLSPNRTRRVLTMDRTVCNTNNLRPLQGN